jgi:hypothetical protein
MKKGMNYHFPDVNITAGWADLTTSIMHNGSPVNWKPLAKDGADLPSYQQIIRPALNQPISVGQTLDFGFMPDKAGEYLFQGERLLWFFNTDKYGDACKRIIFI